MKKPRFTLAPVWGILPADVYFGHGSAIRTKKTSVSSFFFATFIHRFFLKPCNGQAYYYSSKPPALLCYIPSSPCAHAAKAALEYFSDTILPALFHALPITGLLLLFISCPAKLAGLFVLFSYAPPIISATDRIIFVYII